MPAMACATVPEPETSDLRIARNLLLIVLAVLLLPYLLAPLYRAGHPVSTLMAWRWLTGAPVSRQWIDFGAISPSLPRSVVGVRGRQILQPSRRRLGRAARGDRRRRGRRGDPRRLDHHPAGGEKPVPVAGPQRGPQGAGVAAGAVDRLRAAEAADPGNLSQHRRARALRPVRRASRRRLRLRPSGLQPVAARGGAAGGDPAQSGQAQRPQSRPRGAPAGRDLYGPGAGRRSCSAAGAKIAVFEPFWPYFEPSFAPVHPL